MNVALSEAKGQLAELVRRAQAGEEVVLTRHGQPTVRLTPVDARKSPDEMRAALNAIMEEARRRGLNKGPSSKEIQDSLYDEFGLPA